MTAMTNEEVLNFLSQNSWATGIKANNRDLYYEDSDAKVLAFEFPKTPSEATYLARLIAMLGDEDESMFYGALLWITIYDIWSPQLEKAGWHMIEMMRHGFGEIRPIEAAPGHWFRNGAVVDFAAFILVCLIFQWDAYLVPSGSRFFVHISHDEYWVVVTRDQETYDKLQKSLSELNVLEINPVILRSYCPNSTSPEA